MRKWGWRVAASALTGVLGFAVLGFAVLGSAGCIVQAPLEKPSQTGGRWIELSSKHFTVATDLDADEATRVIRTFELAYALLEHAVFRGALPPDFQTRAVVFASEREGREFLPEMFGGQYIRQLASDLQPSPTMVVYGKLSPAVHVALVHELAHRFNQYALGSMPVWLNEGLAEFYSTLRGDPRHPQLGALDPDNGFASGSVISDPNHIVYQGRLYAPAELPRASRLLTFEGSQFYARELARDKDAKRLTSEALDHNYAAAWALVHMLMMTDSENALAFREALREGARTHNATRALDQVGLDKDALDRELDAYLRKPLSWREHHEIAPPVLGEVARRDLSEAQALVLWARLASLRSERGQRYMQSAFAAAPGDPEVRFWYGRMKMLKGERDEAERLFKEALAQDPDNGGYELGLVALYLGGNQRKSWSAADLGGSLTGAMEHLTSVARTPAELDTVAIYHLLQDRPEVAKELAARACQAGADCWECFHTYAEASSRTGDAAGAVSLEREALARLPEDASNKVDLALRNALRRYREVEADPASAAPAHVDLFLPW
jgi:tetratricopeptide (TPR) repeat protein